MNWKQIFAIVAMSAAFSTQAGAAKGGAGGGGGGGGVPTENPLPLTPPAPDVLLRESFGPGLDPIFARPQGGNGNLRAVIGSTDLSGFWLEFPGSKKAEWTIPQAGPGWVFAFASLNPFETLSSPIQPLPFDGVAFSEWRDGVLAFPDLLVPFAGPATKYSVSAEMFPAFLPGSYVGLGLTGSGALNSNLPASGQIWLRLSQAEPFDGFEGRYEVLSGATVLASGAVDLGGFNPVVITVDPVARTVNVKLNFVDLGTWAARITPGFLAFEGQGWADDLLVRTVR
jgi:hypothetical protein